jgi:Na+/H+ antiporter
VHGADAVLLVGAAAAVAGIARRLGWSAPLLLVGAGLGASYLPGLPDYGLDPWAVLHLVVPPLLFAAAWQSSAVSFRQNLRPIGLLSVGLVLFTTLVVGVVAWSVSPELSLAAAFALGAIVAPPDSVVAMSVGRSAGLPRRLVVILAGESLLNDAMALTAYRVAVVAATTVAFSWLAGGRAFAFAAVGGAAIGVALAWVGGALLRWLTDAVLENTVILATPFLGYALADRIHASGELAIVVAGLILGHRSPSLQTYASRLQAIMIWKLTDFLLESVVFALIGLQLPSVLAGLSGHSIAELAGLTAAVVAAVVMARFVWIYPATYLPRRFSRRIRQRDPAPTWRYPLVLSWTGMRGVVSLAAASALPAAFPHRDLILFLTFAVVVGTLMLQGLTLPAVIRRLGVTGADGAADTLAEAAAQHSAAKAGLSRLDVLLAARGRVPDEVVRRLRDRAETRQFAAWERIGGDPEPGSETPTGAYRRLLREMMQAERGVFIELRDAGRIDDEVLRRVQLELDLEEAMLARE